MMIICHCGKHMEVPVSYPFESDPRCLACQPLYAMFSKVYQNDKRLEILARYESHLAAAMTGS